MRSDWPVRACAERVARHGACRRAQQGGRGRGREAGSHARQGHVARGRGPQLSSPGACCLVLRRLAYRGSCCRYRSWRPCSRSTGRSGPCATCHSTCRMSPCHHGIPPVRWSPPQILGSSAHQHWQAAWSGQQRCRLRRHPPRPRPPPRLPLPPPLPPPPPPALPHFRRTHSLRAASCGRMQVQGGSQRAHECRRPRRRRRRGRERTGARPSHQETRGNLVTTEVSVRGGASDSSCVSSSSRGACSPSRARHEDRQCADCRPARLRLGQVRKPLS